MQFGRQLVGFGRRYSRIVVIAGFGLALALSLRAALPASASTEGAVAHRNVVVRSAFDHDISRPLRTIVGVRPQAGRRLMAEHELPRPVFTGRPDPVVQR